MPSIGIRPGVVYGVGRDQGMTSKTTLAILAAALGREYEVPFRGSVSYLYAARSPRRLSGPCPGTATAPKYSTATG